MSRASDEIHLSEAHVDLRFELRIGKGGYLVGQHLTGIDRLLCRPSPTPGIPGRRSKRD